MDEMQGLGRMGGSNVVSVVTRRIGLLRRQHWLLIVIAGLAVACAACVPVVRRAPTPAPTVPPPTTTTTAPSALAGPWHFEDVDGNGVTGPGRTTDGTDSQNTAATLNG